MTIPLSETPTVGLGQFIKEGRFAVPSHQRDYSWREEYVSQFLEDIEEAMRRNEEIYFCGLMVFTKSASPLLSVLDGQQRLATTLMILSAVRNWLRGYSAYKRAETQIEERYLGNSDLGSDKVEPKLLLNTANNDTFHRYVTEAVPISDIAKEVANCKAGDRNKTILEAALYLNKRIIKTAENFGTQDEARDYFLDLINYITDTVQIVRLVVSGDEAAYTIFETLNDRGLDLAPLDLVKNFLFSRAERLRSGSLRDLEERWTEMMTLLEGVKADSFLRAFWASRQGSTEGRKLFAAFKKTYAQPAKAFATSIEMRAAAEHYVALFDSRDPTWAPYSDKLRASVDALKIIGASQTHPIILAAIPKFEKREMERLLWLLEVIAVRYQLVARGRAGRIESLGGRAAKEITEGKITTASQAHAALRELYIADEIFLTDFAVKTERESKKARYLLIKLEREALLREGKTFPDELVPGKVTLEHILPRNPGSAWEKTVKSDPDILADCLLRLGNMCLLTDVNRALGNKSIDDKKTAFTKSRLQTTNSVAQFGKWGRDEIDRRQRHLAKLAVSAWKFQ